MRRKMLPLITAAILLSATACGLSDSNASGDNQGSSSPNNSSSSAAPQTPGESPDESTQGSTAPHSITSVLEATEGTLCQVTFKAGMETWSGNLSIAIDADGHKATLTSGAGGPKLEINIEDIIRLRSLRDRGITDGATATLDGNEILQFALTDARTC